MMKVIKYLFQGLSWLVIAVIVMFMVIAAPILLGFHPTVVLTGSMEPTFPVGSIVYYHKCDFEDLQVGDPITFRAEEALIMHRITTVNGLSRTVVTKGDNNQTEDPVPVSEAEIVGKTTKFAIPFAGYFVTYGKNPIVIIVMAVLLLMDHCFEHFYDRRKGESNNDEQKE